MAATVTAPFAALIGVGRLSVPTTNLLIAAFLQHAGQDMQYIIHTEQIGSSAACSCDSVMFECFRGRWSIGINVGL